MAVHQLKICNRARVVDGNLDVRGAFVWFTWAVLFTIGIMFDTGNKESQLRSRCSRAYYCIFFFVGVAWVGIPITLLRHTMIGTNPIGRAGIGIWVGLSLFSGFWAITVLTNKYTNAILSTAFPAMRIFLVGQITINAIVLLVMMTDRLSPAVLYTNTRTRDNTEELNEYSTNSTNSTVVTGSLNLENSKPSGS
jgi:hypothetical protein